MHIMSRWVHHMNYQTIHTSRSLDSSINTSNVVDSINHTNLNVKLVS